MAIARSRSTTTASISFSAIGEVRAHPNHLDFTVFEIAQSGSKLAKADRKRWSITAAFRPASTSASTRDLRSRRSGHLHHPRAVACRAAPDWTAWDLRDGQKVVSIHPDGCRDYFSRTAVRSPSCTVCTRDDVRSRQPMTVSRGGRRKTFEIPRSMQSENWRQVVSSSNGRWIASKVGKRPSPSGPPTDGKTLQEYRIAPNKGATFCGSRMREIRCWSTTAMALFS